MPRKHPQPFWREARQCWFVQIRKRQIRLSPDKDEAFRLYHELMARPPEARAPEPPPSALTVVELIDLFLEWASRNRERLTYEAYRRRLQALVDAIPAMLPAGELKPYHVTRVMDAKPWNANTRNDFAVAVQRAYNWAVRQGLIPRNPVAHVEKPGREARELAIGPKDYAEVMAAVAEPHFRTLLELAWETGARVQELRKIEARYCDLASNRIVFPPREAKGRRHHRVIYLGTARAREIVAELCERHPAGPILLNSKGRPWTKDAINCAFCRLQKKIGRKLHLGAWRKGFATEALKNGVDVHTTAHLLGHSDSAMLSRVYARVQADPEFMARAARRARGTTPEA
ncbi:tyrosine-type recombinase/integrase [Tautonia rosea]|uniref:tyrosine-type recombinase/integrase n=1 Tax=Tautonia rosea TaxID=2728037 RepID=UPI0014761BC0|nr:site-specific integrase [Tautonia rosea]